VDTKNVLNLREFISGSDVATGGVITAGHLWLNRCRTRVRTVRRCKLVIRISEKLKKSCW